MAGEIKDGREGTALDRVIALLLESLDLLDAHDGPPQAAAHLELALCELKVARSAPRKGK